MKKKYERLIGSGNKLARTKRATHKMFTRTPAGKIFFCPSHFCVRERYNVYRDVFAFLYH